MVHKLHLFDLPAPRRKRPSQLSWGEEGTIPPGFERAELADGTIILDRAVDPGDIPVRFCPNPPAGCRSGDISALRRAHPEGSAAWREAAAYDPRIGSPIAVLYGRHLAYQVVEEARAWAGTGLTQAAITAAGFRCQRLADGTSLHTRANRYGTLRLRLSAASAEIAFVRTRTGSEILIARFQLQQPDETGAMSPVRWPDGWGSPAHVVPLALYALDWAERCGITGPANCVLPRPAL